MRVQLKQTPNSDTHTTKDRHAHNRHAHTHRERETHTHTMAEVEMMVRRSKSVMREFRMRESSSHRDMERKYSHSSDICVVAVVRVASQQHESTDCSKHREKWKRDIVGV